MLTIDDSAILKRAKELCERSGLAWNLLSRTSREMRILTDRDRRECLMRARDELMRAAEETGVPETAATVASSQTVDKVSVLVPAPTKAAVTAPARRVA